MIDIGSLIGGWIIGLLTGLALRIGREKNAELRGIAIGRRQRRSQAYRRD